jgi:molecular chaperone GrpE
MTDAASQTAPQPEPQADAEATSVDALRAALATLQADRDAQAAAATDWRERCARMQAEFDNTRRRLRKEADEAGDRAIARAVRPFLDQIDNLDRALATARPEAFAEFAQGVQLVRENFAAALAASSLVTVPETGAFDPAVHEVLAEMDAEGLAKGHIIQVHRKGYKLKELLVRTAQVVVAK